MRRVTSAVVFFLTSAIFFWLVHCYLHPVVRIGVAYNVAPYAMIPEAKMLASVKAYADWHNSMKGRFRYEIISREYRDDPKEAMEYLKSHGARVIVGFPFSQGAIAAAEVANGGLKVPVLSTIASTPILSGRDDWFFRTREDFSYETEQMARLIEKLGVKRLAAFWSGDNPAYAEESSKAIISKISASIVGVFRFSDDCHSLDFAGSVPLDMVLIYAEPAVSYWVMDFVRARWPDAALFLSRWSLFESSGHIEDMDGIKFYFSEVYDPTDFGEGGFHSYWRSLTSMKLGASVRYTYGAMALLSLAFNDDPRASGSDLREALSIPRSVESLGWTFDTDVYGDVSSNNRFFLFDDGSYREVTP